MKDILGENRENISQLICALILIVSIVQWGSDFTWTFVSFIMAITYVILDNERRNNKKIEKLRDELREDFEIELKKLK